MKGRLRSVLEYKWRPFEGLPMEYVVRSNESLEVVNKFCYLSDIRASAGGGVEESIVIGRNLGIFCLYLLPWWFRYIQKETFPRHMSGAFSERRGISKAGEKGQDDGTVGVM